jgi:hypothetical protein
MDKHNIKSKINQEIIAGKNTLMERSKQTSEQTKMRCDKNYITIEIIIMIICPTLHSRCGINKGLIKKGSTIDH